jgi:hypothetical protein
MPVPAAFEKYVHLKIYKKSLPPIAINQSDLMQSGLQLQIPGIGLG